MDLNRIEIFKIAEQLEEQGIEFYQKAAEFVTDNVRKKAFFDLSEAESNHWEFFHSLEQKYRTEAYIDADEVAKYLSAGFRSRIFETDNSEAIWKSIKTLEDIYIVAKGKEEDTVRYYSFILEHLKSSEAKEAVKKVIEEEKKHIELIQSYIEALLK